MSEATVTRPETRRHARPDALRGAAVQGIGVAVPATVVANQPIADRLGVSADWIVARTGVHERHVAAPGEGVVELASSAALRALEAADTEPEAVDLVAIATMSHDRLIPSAAPLVAERIGASNAGAIDLSAACSGFVSALALAAGMVEAGRARTVLVVGADVLTPLTDHEDRSTAALFGDGAGAAVVGVADGPGRIGPSILGSDGARSDLITTMRQDAVIRMKGHDTFRQAVDRLSEATVNAVAAADKSLDEIDVFAYHQANSRILVAVGERLGLDPARVIDCIGGYGNTSAATIPLALWEARESGMLEPGDSVLLAAFGGGLTWAATVVEWGAGDEC